jgi:RND family efflux transporter MFP subunit
MTGHARRRAPAVAWWGGLLLAAACRAASPAETHSAAEATPVSLAPVVDTAVVEPVTGTGVLAAKEEVPLGFKIGGVVGRILVEEGETVAAGQVLATLEQPEIAGEVAKAEAAAAQAERDLARAEALYRDSVVPRAAWEGAGTAAEVARANLRIARFNQRYAVIRAPGAATVLRRMAEPFQQVAAGTPILLLAGRDSGQVVRVGLADRDAARVRLDDRATISFDALPVDTVTGRVSQLAAQATAGTGTWTVEIRLDRPVRIAAGGTASGLIGRVEIEPRQAERVRLVPLEALLEGDGDSALVYSVAGARAVQHRVRLGMLTRDRAAVRSGLEGVPAVVVKGAAYLTDSAPVVIVRDGVALPALPAGRPSGPAAGGAP